MISLTLLGYHSSPSSAAPPRAKALVLIGLSGDIVHAKRYSDAGGRIVRALTRLGYDRGNLLYLFEDGTSQLAADAAPAESPDGASTLENFRAALTSHRRSAGADDSLLLVLAGHVDKRVRGDEEGGWSDAWNMHLPSGDLGYGELKKLVADMPGRIVIVALTPYGGALTELGGDRIAVLSATRKTEKYPISQPAAGAVAFEALAATEERTLGSFANALNRSVSEWYKAENFLRNEQIDSNLVKQPALGDILLAPPDGASPSSSPWNVPLAKAEARPALEDPLVAPWDLVELRRLSGAPTESRADAQVLFRAIDYTIDEAGTLMTRRREIIRIHSAHARDRGDMEFFYHPPDEKWELIHARVISADSIAEVDTKEIIEASGVNMEQEGDSGSMLNRGKFVQIHLPGMTPGVIADVAVVTHFRSFGASAIPTLEEPVGGPEGVELLSLRFTFPRRAKIALAGYGLPEWKKEETRYAQVYTLRVTNLPPVKPEPYAPPYDELVPRVILAEAESWDEIARWYTNLSRETQSANEKVSQEAAKIVRNQPLRELYDWVAQNIRYVHIPLGVHGYKPHLPAETLRRGWGDCKDKAVLMISALAGLGETAQIALIRAGGGDIVATAPRKGAFNHAIVAIPDSSSSGWFFLDPTSEVAPYGTLPEMDEGREALIVRGDEGILVRTPVSTAEQNAIDIVRSAASDPLGVNVEETRVHRGQAAFAQRIVKRGAGADMFEQYLAQQLSARTPGARLLNWSDEGADSPSAEYTLKLTYRIPSPENLIPVPLATLGFEFPPPPRTLPIRLPFAMLIHETTVISGPSVRTESLPSDRELRNSAGEHVLRFRRSENGEDVISTRMLKLPEKDMPKERYEDLIAVAGFSPVFLGAPSLAGGLATSVSGRLGWIIAGAMGLVIVVLLGAMLVKRSRHNKDE